MNPTSVADSGRNILVNNRVTVIHRVGAIPSSSEDYVSEIDTIVKAWSKLAECASVFHIHLQTELMESVTSHKFPLNTGDAIPALGLGTWQSSPSDVSRAVEHALKNGYCYIDTAHGYGNETEVGQGIRASGVPRENIFVTTKLDNDWHHRSAEGLDASLESLGLDYVDLFLMHWPCAIDPKDDSRVLPNWDFVRTWSEMQKLPATGKCRAIGVSNFGIRYLERLLAATSTSIVPAVNQIELHPYCPSPKLARYCTEKGIHLTGYSCLGSTNSKVLSDQVVLELAQTHAKTPAQILLKWGVQNGWDVIPKSVTPSRIDENFKLDGWALSATEMDKLNSRPQRFKVCDDEWLPESVFFSDDE